MNSSRNRLLLGYLNNIYSYNVDSWVLIFLLRAFYIKKYVIYILLFPPPKVQCVVCPHWCIGLSAQRQTELALLKNRVRLPGQGCPCLAPAPAGSRSLQPPWAAPGPHQVLLLPETPTEVWLPKNPHRTIQTQNWFGNKELLKLKDVIPTFIFQLWRKIIFCNLSKKTPTLV